MAAREWEKVSNIQNEQEDLNPIPAEPVQLPHFDPPAPITKPLAHTPAWRRLVDTLPPRLPAFGKQQGIKSSSTLDFCWRGVGEVPPESKAFEELFKEPFFSLSLDIFKTSWGDISVFVTYQFWWHFILGDI